MAVLRYFTELRQREFAEGKHKPKRHPKPGVPVPVAGQKAGRGVRLLEGLAASGLRAIRYALEVRAWPSRVYIRVIELTEAKTSGSGTQMPTQQYRGPPARGAAGARNLQGGLVASGLQTMCIALAVRTGLNGACSEEAGQYGVAGLRRRPAGVRAGRPEGI